MCANHSIILLDNNRRLWLRSWQKHLTAKKDLFYTNWIRKRKKNFDRFLFNILFTKYRMLVLVFICRSVFLFEDVIQQYAFPSLENLSFMSKALEMTNVNIYYNFRISLKLFTRFSFIFFSSSGINFIVFFDEFSTKSTVFDTVIF